MTDEEYRLREIKRPHGDKTTLSIDRPLYERIKSEAVRRGVTTRSIAQVALNEWLERNEGKE